MSWLLYVTYSMLRNNASGPEIGPGPNIWHLRTFYSMLQPIKTLMQTLLKLIKTYQYLWKPIKTEWKPEWKHY